MIELSSKEPERERHSLDVFTKHTPQNSAMSLSGYPVFIINIPYIYPIMLALD